MNYNISRIEMMILEVFALFDIAKVKIKKEHQLLMVGETTSFKKGKGKKEDFMKRQISCCSSEETQSLNPNPRLSASVMRGTVTEAELP